MNRGLVLRRSAEREFSKAISWYEEQLEGLGQEFRLAIHQQFDRIAAHPEMFPIVRSEVRRAVIVKRFPFVIHFLVEMERIVILSVFRKRHGGPHLTEFDRWIGDAVSVRLLWYDTYDARRWIV